jgi:myosin heavy subunit
MSYKTDPGSSGGNRSHEATTSTPKQAKSQLPLNPADCSAIPSTTSLLMDESRSESGTASHQMSLEDTASSLNTILGNSFFAKLSQMSQQTVNSDRINEKIRKMEGNYMTILAEKDLLVSRNTELQFQTEELTCTIQAKEKDLKSKNDKRDKLQSSLESKQQNIFSLEREIQSLRKVKIEDKLQNRDTIDVLKAKLLEKEIENSGLMDKIKELIGSNNSQKKDIEKQKKEIKKLLNTKDTAVREKLSVKNELSPTKNHLDHAGGLSDYTSHSQTTPPSAAVTDHRANSPKTLYSHAGRMDVKHQTVKPKSALTMIGDYNLAGISEKLELDSMAFVNRDVTAHSLKKCLPNQAQDQELVLIQCGSNNLNEELRHSIPALGGMLDTALKSCQGQVLINAIPGQLVNDKNNDLAVRINTFLKHKCSKSRRLQYVNCNPALKQ